MVGWGRIATAVTYYTRSAMIIGGGVGAPRPTECNKKCGRMNPPVTASPCQPPLGKEAKGTRVTDCHNQ